jgi:glycosyltransferase involved in cell wall biosynthesis
VSLAAGHREGRHDLRPHDAQTERRSRRHRIAVPTGATADRIVLEIDHKKELLAYATWTLSQLLVANHEAGGLSGGRNTGVAAATGDLIAFIDDDAVIDASWLDIPVARCKGPDILGAGGWTNPLRVGLRPGWLPEEFLSATNSGFATVKFERHWAIARAMLRVGMAE